jgi:hypothetical protein
MRAPRHLRAVLTIAATAAVATSPSSCAPPAGVRIDVTVGSYGALAESMVVVVSADKGFAEMEPMTAEMKATVTTADFNGDKIIDLIIKFPGPFKGTTSFLVATANKADVTVSAHAVAYDASKVIAVGDGALTMIAGGGHVTLPVTLGDPPADQPPVGPATRDTDLGTDHTIVTIQGPGAGANVSTVAVCDLDADGKQDLIVGSPHADHNETDKGTGGVFVVFGAPTSNVKLSGGATSQFSFFGATSGDELGASVACARINDDTVDDLVVGAPGADRVYVVFGRPSLATSKTVDLQNPNKLMAKMPDATWGPATASTPAIGFGRVIVPVDANFDGKAERILVSAPGTTFMGDATKKGLVHLLALPTSAMPNVLLDVEQPDHPTFAGVPATALATGDLDGLNTGLDVILGDKEHVAAGDIDPSGAIIMFANVDPAMPKAYDATSTVAGTRPSTIMVGDSGTQFGASLQPFDTTRHGQDLYVGAPFAGVGKRGLVYVLEHQDTFFAAPVRTFKPLVTPKLDAGDAAAHFGSTLALCTNGSSPAATFKLLVGAPDANRIGRANVGAAYLMTIGAGFKLTLIERLYGATAQDRLGAAVACGQLDGDKTADVVAAAPTATPDLVSMAGAAYVRYSRPEP